MGGSSAPADAGNYTALLVSSLVVFALLVALLWALARWKNGRGGRLGADATGMLNVRARLTLEPQRTLYVVTVGEKTLLLAAGDQGINLLTDLSTQELPVPPPALSFADLVRTAWSRKRVTSNRETLPVHNNNGADPSVAIATAGDGVEGAVGEAVVDKRSTVAAVGVDVQ